MLKIGYNKSDLHQGSLTHLECPERINYCLRSITKTYPKDFFVINVTHKIETLLEMIKVVHDENYILNLLRFEPKEYICRKCTTKIQSKKNIRDFVVNNETCVNCKSTEREINENEIYCHLDSDTFFTSRTIDIILDGIGVLRQLVDEIKKGVRHCFALIRPPGHHCENSGSGFCILNNVLIATKYAQSQGYAKAFILDIDFHHGDGTQKLLLNNPNLTNIYFCSIHGYGEAVYPGSGSQSENTENILNIPLHIDIFNNDTRKIVDDDYYLDIIKTTVNNYILKVNPDIIFVSCGFDGHQNDTLQGFNLSDNAYKRIAKHLKKYNVPVMYVLEGGYNKYAINNSVQLMITEITS